MPALDASAAPAGVFCSSVNSDLIDGRRAGGLDALAGVEREPRITPELVGFRGCARRLRPRLVANSARRTLRCARGRAPPVTLTRSASVPRPSTHSALLPRVVVGSPSISEPGNACSRSKSPPPETLRFAVQLIRGLRVDPLARRSVLGVVGPVVEHALPRDGVAVRASDGRDGAETDAADILPAQRRVDEMPALIAEPDADRSLPFVGDLRLAADADEIQPVGRSRLVRRGIETDTVRRLVAPVNPANRAADVGVVAHGAAEPAGERLVAVPVVRQRRCRCPDVRTRRNSRSDARCRRAQPTRDWC